MGCAYWIFRDGEFRPIDTAVYCISSILLWPIVMPIWLVLRPPSQIKDLTYEKSYAHFRDWKKTHKVRDIGDLASLDRNLNKGNGAKTEETEDVQGATSFDRPYVIGSAGHQKPNESYSDRMSQDEYGWDEIDDRAPVYEIGTSKPRQVYNPFKKDKMTPEETREPESVHELDLDAGEHTKPRKRVSTPRGESSFNVPSISDILDEPPSQKGTGRVFRDANVRKLIDDGRLRDAYRVSRRMLKVAQELGEEDRVAAYRRYIREIENRMKAAQEKPED